MSFTKDDKVYTQDGTQYYFDHAAGDHGYVSPIILIQTTNYHGDDFEEHEEVADHMIPIPLTKLSKTPWVWKVHEETKEAIAEKQAVLAGLDKQIGAARREARQSEEALDARQRELKTLANTLERQYRWVKDLRWALEQEELFMFAWEGQTDMPVKISKPMEMRLRLDKETGVYHYLTAYDYEEDDVVHIFPNEQMRAHAVRKAYAKHDRTMEENMRWHNQWGDVIPLTPAAAEEVAAKKKHKHDKEVAHALKQLNRAQEALDNLLKAE